MLLYPPGLTTAMDYIQPDRCLRASSRVVLMVPKSHCVINYEQAFSVRVSGKQTL